MKKFWFFDLDGTLADTDRDIRESWKAALSDLGLESPDFDEKFVAGPPIDEMAKILFPGRFTPALADAIRAGFAKHYDGDGFPNTREYPGVFEAIRVLRERGASTYIVTNKRYAGATAMFRHFGWASSFDGLYAGDMYMATPIGKLRKDALLARILRELNADPADSVMVGDTSSDFEAAKKNGLESIGVSWGYGKADELAAADLLIDGADGLVTAF